VDQTGIDDVSKCANTRVFRLGSRAKRIDFLRSLLLLRSSELSKIDEQIAFLISSLRKHTESSAQSFSSSQVSPAIPTDNTDK